MTDPLHVTTLNCDDWEAVYFNDMLISQDHSVSADDVLEELIKDGRPVVSHTSYFVEDYGWNPYENYQDEIFPQVLDLEKMKKGPQDASGNL